jgi:hypothetical protein
VKVRQTQVQTSFNSTSTRLIGDGTKMSNLIIVKNQGRKLKRSYEKREFEGRRRNKGDMEYPLKRIHTDNNTQERDDERGRENYDDSEKNPRFREEHSDDDT